MRDNILLPYVLYCLRFKGTITCVRRISENSKSLILEDKCNIEIVVSPACSSPIFYQLTCSILVISMHSQGEWNIKPADQDLSYMYDTASGSNITSCIKIDGLQIHETL